VRIRRSRTVSEGTRAGSRVTSGTAGEIETERAKPSCSFHAHFPFSLDFPPGVGQSARGEMPDARGEMPDARCQMPDARCDIRRARCEKEDARAVTREQPPDVDVPSLARRFLDMSSLDLSDFSDLSFFLSSGTPSSTCAQRPAGVSGVPR
jgi:hypothetical protein